MSRNQDETDRKGYRVLGWELVAELAGPRFIQTWGSEASVKVKQYGQQGFTY